MRIERTSDGDIAIVALEDEDNSNLGGVADRIGQLIEAGTTRIVFDLHGFHVFGTSTAVAYLAATQARLRRGAGQSAVVDRSGAYRDVLNAMGVEEDFRTFARRGEALAYLRDSE
ncbi:MAG: STAS domain-containing protein [Planctomycetota bacterium]|jgi:anti-anti-sigma regulatory factor